MKMEAAAATKKKKGSPINLDSSPDPAPRGSDDVGFASPTPAARKGDVYPVSPPSAPAKDKGKRKREEAGMSDDELRREVAEMSDDELRREIGGLPKSGLLVGRQKRLFPLLGEEARRRWPPTDAAKDGGDRSRGSRSRAEKVYTFDIEDELTEDDSRKYCPKSSLIRPMKKNYGPVNDVIFLDDEDVQPDEPVDRGVLNKSKELKTYYPSSDDPEAVELSSSDIKCLSPGVYLSSPVINYYIQYIKRAEMHIEYGKDKFYMFNTFFYSKLQEALLDKGKFLRLRRWWKGVNIFQRGYLILPIHGTSHWSLIIVCIPAKESNSGPIILHLDSLGLHPSDEIFDTVGRYLEEEWHHLRKNPPSDISISDTIWQDLPRNIRKEKVEVPGQNNAYDCGVFMLYYIQQFIKEAPERFTRDSLDMFSRSWFISEVASDLRKKIRKLLLELFENARVDGVVSEAAAPDGWNEDCVIKEGESGAVTPCDSSEMAVGDGDTSKRDDEDFMEVISMGGTPPTTLRSDGRIGDCALSEAATLSDSLQDEDDTRIGGCALSEAAKLSDSLKEDDDDTMNIDSDSSKTEQDIEILPSDSSKTEQDIEILPPGSSKTEQDIEILSSGSSKNNEEVIHRAPGPD